jgi:hypothetical protein
MNYGELHVYPLKNLLMKLRSCSVNESAHFWPEKRPKIEGLVGKTAGSWGGKQGIARGHF